MGRRCVVNAEDPFTLQPVDMRSAFLLKGEAGLWHALCPVNLSKCIHATGAATCPYTRRRLSEAELVRLDARLGHSVARSCWFVVARRSARACWGDALVGFRFALADALADALDAGETSAQALLYLHEAVGTLCRRFGHDRVAAALGGLRDEEERSLGAALNAQLCSRLLRAAEEFGQRGAHSR